jgi:hypothetical protein
MLHYQWNIEYYKTVIKDKNFVVYGKRKVKKDKNFVVYGKNVMLSEFQKIDEKNINHSDVNYYVIRKKDEELFLNTLSKGSTIEEIIKAFDILGMKFNHSLECLNNEDQKEKITKYIKKQKLEEEKTNKLNPIKEEEYLSIS